MPDEAVLSRMAVDLGKNTAGLSSARNRLCTLGQLQTPEQGCAHLGSGIRILLGTTVAECVAQHGDTRKCQPYLSIKHHLQGTGELAQWPRALAVLAKDPDSVPSTRFRWLTTSCHSSSRGSAAVF